MKNTSKALLVNNGQLELTVGLILKVNYSHHAYKEVTDYFKVIDTEADDNCGNTIKLQVLASKDEYGQKTFNDRFSIVEELWFDGERTGRKIEVITEEFILS